MIMENLYSLHRQREAGLVGDVAYSKCIRNSPYLVTRLKRTDTLKGHTGCVNSISWNESGSRLISASDDCHLNFYDTARGIIWHRVHTSHQSNIFSAKFLPRSNDLRAVSCAGVGTVEFSDLSPDGEYVGHRFQCQTSLTYQVATTPTDGNEFMTCEEKGYIRLFDLREKASCHCSGCKKDVIYDFPSSVTCMSVHPLSPHYVAFGLGDGTIRLLDRRKVGVGQSPVHVTTPSDLARMSTHHKYRPSSFGDQPRKITSIQFNPVGSELLASYSEDYVYLFNSGVFGIGESPSVTVQKPSHIFERYSPMIGRKRRDSVRHKPFPLRRRHEDPIETPRSEQQAQPLVSEPSPPASGTTEEPPPVKKFRLRGDWSDTGPNARPEGAEGSHEPRREGLSNVLINRMSRMFAQWIDMSQSPEDEGVSGASVRDGPVREEGNRAYDVSLTSSSSSDNSSFNLFDSENEAERQTSSERNATSSPSASRDNSTDATSPPSASRDNSTDGTNINESHCQHDTNNRAAAVNIATSALSSSSPPVSDGERRVHTLELAEDDRTSVRQTTASDIQSGFQCLESTPSKAVCVDGERTLSVDGGSPEKSEQARHGDVLPWLHVPKAESKTLTDSSSKGQSLPLLPPVINIIEGETDSDDDHDRSHDDKQKSHDKSHPSCDTKNPKSASDTNRHLNHDPSILEEGSKSYGPEEGSASAQEEVDEFRDCLQPFMVYKGHRNSRTMIKQANFWGDNWVLSGSDCGRVFVWDKWTGRVVNMLNGDSHVVNCIQPHPQAYVLATSGIDYDIKIWEPSADTVCCLDNMDEVVERNEMMLHESRNTITVPSVFVFRILAYLNRRRRMQRDHPDWQNEELADDQ